VILADTSAGVEFIRGTDSRVDQRVRELIAESNELAVTEPVIMEIAGGARSGMQEQAHRRLLARCSHFTVEVPTDFDGASSIYRHCRSVGVTPRDRIDCVIAAVALRRNAVLLAHDVDLARIAQVMGVDLDPASLRP
jgi:predicted nucleic acid-binding protein